MLLRAAGPVLQRLHTQLLDTRVSVLFTDAGGGCWSAAPGNGA
ncbi:hypothetical protein ACFQZC_34055 [Streptacidiphilus monticola]